MTALDDLRAAQLFANLPDDELEALAAIVRRLPVTAGRVIFSQGEPTEAMFLLREGQVRIYKLRRDGRSASMRHVLAGETFGEAALFASVYPAYSQAMADSFLYRIPKSAFRSLLTERLQLALNLLATQAHLMVMLSQRVEELLLPVPARLARYLRELCAEQGPSCRLPTSKRELAARLGTVPETLSRTLDRFKRAGVIRLTGDALEVLDVAALERLAQD